MLLSAWLVFLVQPMIGRMILPKLGGAAAVWITVTLFFQLALLGGYLYAHLLSARLVPRLQMAVHAALAALSLLFLPIAVPSAWIPPADRPPQLDLILMLAGAIGLPFLTLSATAPLLQRWYSLTDASHARDPYFLYAASNVGSLAALLLYPTLIEPALGLADQSRFWAVSFGLLIFFLIACGAVTLRRAVPVERSVTATAAIAPLGWKRRLHWIALAAVPSSLFLAVTLQISTDIASVPLLWVLPLTLYLLTFVIAFARKPVVSRSAILRAFPYAATIAALVLGLETGIGLAQIAVSAGLLLVFALMCHSELVALRPPPEHLTEYFLLMSLGGALGGAFNAFLAPLLFDGVYEYPIAVLGAVLLWAIAADEDGRPRSEWRWIAAAVLLFVGLRAALLEASGLHALQWLVGLKAAAALLCFAARRKPVLMALLVAATLAASLNLTLRPEIARYRSFFGVHRIELDATHNAHFLMHGNTAHGAQFVDSARRREPLLYYARSGPAGQALDALRAMGPLPAIGVIGLGSGAMVCLSAPGEAWTYFEIDPAIVATARNPDYFTYLADCAPQAEIVLGDGRLSLAARPDGGLAMLTIDAFGSDAIPVHLLTREAFDLYFRKLRPRGVLLLHLSNRNLDLLPVVARLVEDRGLTGRWQQYPGLAEGTLISSSEWAIVARQDADLGSMATDPRWQSFPPSPSDARAWTDDYVNVLSALRWRAWR